MEVITRCNVCGEIKKAEVDEGYLEEYLELTKNCNKLNCNGQFERVE